MKRRLFNAATLVSMLLVVAAVGLWARSYWRTDDLSYRHLFLSSYSGVVLMEWSVPAARGDRWEWASWPTDLVTLSGLWTFGSKRTSVGPPVNPVPLVAYDVVFPHWTIAAGASVAPVWWVVRRRSRNSVGFCPACSYDLRGSEGKTCPECGGKREGDA